MKKIFYFIAIIITVNIAIFSQESKSIDDKIYIDDVNQTVSSGISSSYFTSSDIGNTNVVSGKGSFASSTLTYFLWRAIYKGSTITAYDFFILTGNDVAAQREQVFYDEQTEYHKKTKARLQDEANISWGAWTTSLILSSLLTIIGSATIGNTNNQPASGTVLFLGSTGLLTTLALTDIPISKSNRAKHYNPSYIYTTHSKSYAQEVADNYNR